MKKITSILKVFIYGLLAVFVYMEFIGPVGLAELFNAEISNVEFGDFVIPTYVVKLSIISFILEAISNAIDVSNK